MKIRDYEIPADYDIFTLWKPEQHFQRIDKYSLYLWEEERLETWEEVVARAVDILRYLSKDKLPFEEYQNIFTLMYKLEVMPSMRLMSMSLDAVKRCNTVLYNCTYGLGDTFRSIAEAQYLSMSGCGVAWSVERKNVDKLPVISRLTGEIKTLTVADTQIGWAESTEFLLNNLVSGIDVILDYSQIRPAGSPLKTKGGYASGPDILIDTHNFIRDTMRNAQGRKVTPLEMHDMFCFALESGISGGTRRSAGMCLFDYDNTEITECKYNEFWEHPVHKVRANANNSAVWPDKVNRADVALLTNQLFTTGTGEPGLFKRNNALLTSPDWRVFIHPETVGTNPSLRKGTRVMTDNGVFPIDELQDKDFLVRNLNGEWSPATCFLSGKDKQLWKITLTGGVQYFCTAEHKWPILQGGTFKKTETTDIKIGDVLPINTSQMEFGEEGTNDEGFLLGWLYGDGWITERSDSLTQQVGLIVSEEDSVNGVLNKLSGIVSEYSEAKLNYRKKDARGWYELNTQNACLDNLISSFGASHKSNGLPTRIWSHASKEFVYGFLDGIISSDGSIDIKDGRCSIVTKHKKLADDLLEILGFLGVRSHVKTRKSTPERICNKIYSGDTTFYSFQVTFNCNTLPDGFTLSHTAKNNKLNIAKQIAVKSVNTRRVVSIEKTDLFEDVWDITVFDNTHCFALANIITGNCGEIYLQAIPVDSAYIAGGGWQFCNLSSNNTRHDDTVMSLYTKTKYSTLIGDIQSLATDFQFLRSGTKTICDRERLLGVNLIGYATCPLIRKFPELVEGLRDYAVVVDREFSELFNVNPSAAITSVKPSGNSSVMCYTAPGGNPIHGIYQIRNVTVNRNSAMHKFLVFQGVPRNDYPGRDYASMFSFPIAYPEDSVTLENCDALGQLEVWAFHKKHWTHHNPSVTITYEPHEIEGIRDWLYQNQMLIGGLAFTPKYESSYPLLPIVVVSKEKYSDFTASYPTVDWSVYRKYEVASDERQMVAECAGGVCAIQW